MFSFEEMQLAMYPYRRKILDALKGASMSEDDLTKKLKMRKRIFASNLPKLVEAGFVKTEIAEGVEGHHLSLTENGQTILTYIDKLDMDNITWT
jgi:DNA-binding HxlR family transcriptional regulator